MNNDLDAPEPSPAVGDDGFEGLHPAARGLLRVQAALLAVIVGVAASIPLTVLLDLGRFGIGGRLALPLLLVALLLALALPYAGARWRRTRFRLDDDGLVIRRGVFWRRETVVPRSRVQHVDLNHGPIDRRLGLAELKVYTAGTRLASVGLGGIEEQRAHWLRDDLVSAHGDGSDG